jgi:hypothetical protein
MKRLVPAALCVPLLLWACGGGELSLTDYVDRVDGIMQQGLRRYEALIASPQGEVLVAEGDELADFTPQDLQVALEQLSEIQAEALEAAFAIDPPEDIADLHALFFRRLPISELAGRAGTAADWHELSASPEMAAYRNGLVEDERVCEDFQATLDATAERGVFADNPWLPGELTEIVEYALGCGSLLEHPEDVYRPPPATSPR